MHGDDYDESWMTTMMMAMTLTMTYDTTIDDNDEEDDDNDDDGTMTTTMTSGEPTRATREHETSTGTVNDECIIQAPKYVLVYDTTAVDF